MFTQFLELRLRFQPDRLNPEEEKFFKIKAHLKTQGVLGENKRQQLDELFDENHEGEKKTEEYFMSDQYKVWMSWF